MKEIQLTQGKVALVDDEDFERINRLKWHADKKPRQDKWYARNKHTRMHREVLNVPAGIEIDHRNGNGLDNQKHNLRICAGALNKQNRKPQTGSRSPYKGVRHRGRNCFRAEIAAKSIGHFPNAVAAAVAYDMAAIILFGEFAQLNFPGCYV